jgi:hypothetical protein
VIEVHVEGPVAAARLTAGQLSLLGAFLHGRRWKAALARELQVDRRLVQRWANGERPISARCAWSIIALVTNRHRRRVGALEIGYRGMVESLEPSPFRDRLLDVAR